ncbi:MAG: molybdopterin dinucleotide binding domain-containing protein, partial [Rhodospirillales bacterium]|nr:molybdopterin dinucleotide binding domain-containing protein [Rhodospirillales bacterium]
TAADYDVYDGEWIYLKNDLGKVKRKVMITKRVKPTEIQTLHGWWMPEQEGAEPNLFGVWDYQINQLVPGPQESQSGFGGGQYKTTLVTLEKINEGAQANG